MARPTDKPQPTQYVIPIVAGIGNALMTVPMVRRLKQAVPEARVSIVSISGAMAEPFRRLPEVDEVAVVDGSLALIRELRRRRADVLIVPFPSNRWQYNLLQRFSRAGRRIMHGYPVGKFAALSFFDAERVPAEMRLHDVVQNLRLLEPLGVDPGVPANPVFNLNDNDKAEAKQLLSTVGLKADKSFLLVHGGSAQTALARAKRWPPNEYAMLIKAVRRSLKIPVLVIEGPDEPGVSNEIVGRVGNDDGVKKLTLSCPLGVSAAVLAGAKAYVGSDSGLAHLAAAVGTPPVTLFAPADPDRVSPFGHRQLVVQPNKACSPCAVYPWKSCKPGVRCGEPPCITEIKLEQIMAKLRFAIGHTTDVRG